MAVTAKHKIHYLTPLENDNDILDLTVITKRLSDSVEVALVAQGELISTAQTDASDALTAASAAQTAATAASTAASNAVPTSRTLSVQGGLIGGGNLTANRSFKVGQGNGIKVTTTAVEVDDTVVALRSWVEDQLNAMMLPAGPAEWYDNTKRTITQTTQSLLPGSAPITFKNTTSRPIVALASGQSWCNLDINVQGAGYIDLAMSGDTWRKRLSLGRVDRYANYMDIGVLYAVRVAPGATLSAQCQAWRNNTACATSFQYTRVNIVPVGFVQ